MSVTSTGGSTGASSGASARASLRQFGLYRSIDSRTEEFLRLSRRRQLKQGCACAAISTAVTVTIVICLIFVYEYVVISEKSKNISHKWRNLMNSSSDPYENINLDSSTVKLLPILLKRLRQNLPVDKIINDSNIYNDATEPHTIRMFPDIRKLVRKPSARSYTIDYNPLPFSSLNAPGRYIDKYTKTNQKRDYQKIKKVTPFKSTLPVAEIITYSAIDSKKTTNKIIATKSPYQNKTYVENHITIENNRKANIIKETICKCKHRLSIMLNKIIKCLQKSMIELENLHNNMNPVDVMIAEIAPTTVRTTTKNNQKIRITTSPKNILERSSTFRYSKISKTPLLQIHKNGEKYAKETLHSILNILRPNFINLKTNEVGSSDEAITTDIPLPVGNNFGNISANSFKNDSDSDKTKKEYRHAVLFKNKGVLENENNTLSLDGYLAKTTDNSKNTNVITEQSERKLENESENLKGETSYRSIPFFNNFLKYTTMKYTKPLINTPSTKLLPAMLVQKPYKKISTVQTKPKLKDKVSSVYSIYNEHDPHDIFSNIDQLTDGDWNVEVEDDEQFDVDNIYRSTENTTNGNHHEENKRRGSRDALNLDVVFDYNHYKPFIRTARPSYLEMNRNTWRSMEKQA